MFGELMAFLNVLGLVAIGMGVIGLVLLIVAGTRIKKANKEQAKEPVIDPTGAELTPGETEHCQAIGDRNKYIAKIQAMLFEDLNSKGDVSTNGIFAIIEISEQYQGKVEQRTIDSVMDTARWIQKYFTHCRHIARPIDGVLVTGLINSLDYV